jgi:hypothetical protein
MRNILALIFKTTGVPIFDFKRAAISSAAAVVELTDRKTWGFQARKGTRSGNGGRRRALA